MKLLRRLALFAFVLLLAAPLCVRAADSRGNPVNFGANDNVLELKGSLAPYRAPGGTETDGSSWYIVQVSNDSVRPATRVLLAGQPPRARLPADATHHLADQVPVRIGVVGVPRAGLPPRIGGGERPGHPVPVP